MTSSGESPSLLLQRAADKLSEMAELASPPQWSADDLTDAGHPGVWWVRADYKDETSTGSHCVAELETVNPKADATWIATMSPAVAAPLVAWLRKAADDYKSRERLPKLGDPNPYGAPIDLTGSGLFGPSYWETALEFARLIVGEPRKD